MYHALSCHIAVVAPGSAAHREVLSLFKGSPSIKVENIFSLSREEERTKFKKTLQNQRLLLHGSKPHNLLGILSRGLLLPVVLEGSNLATRSDFGYLGIHAV